LRFVVDGMLGGLARWLRMLGYETEYDPPMNDNTLLQHSMSQGTILLTLDQELQDRAKKKGISSVLVLGKSEKERLAHLANIFHIPLEVDMATTRCPVCGAPLNEIDKEEASRLVPPASVKLYDRFWKCSNSNCSKAYWMGSHWKRIRETLEEAKKPTSR
jgi:uncharacterized protein